MTIIVKRPATISSRLFGEGLQDMVENEEISPDRRRKPFMV